MNTFRDNAGREWAVSIHVLAIERVQDKTGVKIGALIRDGLAGLLELADDPVKFVRVLWVLVEEQAAALSVAPEQFGRAMGGDALEAAFDAFVNALADFSPSRLRSLIRGLTAKTSPTADQPTSSSSVTNSPASSESIPAG